MTLCPAVALNEVKGLLPSELSNPEIFRSLP